MWKLVRDKIVANIENAGGGVSHAAIPGVRWSSALRFKVCEEALELFGARSAREILEEIVDIEDVLNRLKEVHGFSNEDIQDQRQRKIAEKGGFQEMIEADV